MLTPHSSARPAGRAAAACAAARAAARAAGHVGATGGGAAEAGPAATRLSWRTPSELSRSWERPWLRAERPLVCCEWCSLAAWGVGIHKEGRPKVPEEITFPEQTWNVTEYKEQDSSLLLATRHFYVASSDGMCPLIVFKTSLVNTYSPTTANKFLVESWLKSKRLSERFRICIFDLNRTS